MALCVGPHAHTASHADPLSLSRVCLHPAPSPPALSPAKPLSSISTAGRGHSADMIAITTILSILLAILLAGLVAMLFFWG